jgi:hypothetical protein
MKIEDEEKKDKVKICNFDVNGNCGTIHYCQSCKDFSMWKSKQKDVLKDVPKGKYCKLCCFKIKRLRVFLEDGAEIEQNFCRQYDAWLQEKFMFKIYLRNKTIKCKQCLKEITK